MADATPIGLRFAARLRTLMEAFSSPELGTAPLTVGRLYSLIENEPGVDISRAHFYHLADGTAVPRLDLIDALARFFRVPAKYFVDDAEPRFEEAGQINAVIDRIDASIALLHEIRMAMIRERDKAERRPHRD